MDLPIFYIHLKLKIQFQNGRKVRTIQITVKDKLFNRGMILTNTFKLMTTAIMSYDFHRTLPITTNGPAYFWTSDIRYAYYAMDQTNIILAVCCPGFIALKRKQTLHS